MPCGGTPAAARIDWISCVVSAAARSFGVPDGTSIRMPPVASRFHTCAKASTSARCAGVRPPRLVPTKTSTVRVAFLERDRMALAIVGGHGFDVLLRRVAAGERGGEAGDRREAADACRRMWRGR